MHSIWQLLSWLQVPGYLAAEAVLQEAHTAFAEWEKATNLHFVHSSDEQECDIVIEWSDTSPDNMLPFGAPGGALAVTKKVENKEMIFLDETERWLPFDHVSSLSCDGHN